MNNRYFQGDERFLKLWTYIIRSYRVGKMNEYIVSAEQEGMRLDVFLTEQIERFS